MLNDTADVIIGTEPVTPAPEAISTDTDTTTAETEQQLAAEISELWAIHIDTKAVVRKTQQELKAIRERLGQNLHALKRILSKRGRSGQWSSYLAQAGISRTTADRLAAAHAKKMNPDENGTTGSIPEMTDEEIAELAKSVWKKLEKKLGTKSSVYKFLGRVMVESGLSHFRFQRGDKHGLALVDPDAVSILQATAAATAASDAVPTNAA